MKQITQYLMPLLLILGGPSRQDATKEATGIFKDAYIQNATIVLEFESMDKSPLLFDARKSETKPYVFFTITPSGQVEKNKNIVGRSFELSYSETIKKEKHFNYLTKIKIKNHV
jgi:hypothetical protein